MQCSDPRSTMPPKLMRKLGEANDEPEGDQSVPVHAQTSAYSSTGTARGCAETIMIIMRADGYGHQRGTIKEAHGRCFASHRAFRSMP